MESTSTKYYVVLFDFNNQEAVSVLARCETPEEAVTKLEDAKRSGYTNSIILKEVKFDLEYKEVQE